MSSNLGKRPAAEVVDGRPPSKRQKLSRSEAAEFFSQYVAPPKNVPAPKPRPVIYRRNIPVGLKERILELRFGVNRSIRNSYAYIGRVLSL